MILYNEIDPYAAQWLRNLIAAGEIAPGEVVETPLQALDPAALVETTQFHTCAGIGTWSRALQEAGWPDSAEVWTASLPCQPFSTAGRTKGFEDDRHLWPAYFRLVQERRPPVVLLEQVASPAGRAWLDVVLADLEGAGYAVAPFDLPASSVGAPHLRQRLYVVAVADGERLEGLRVLLRTGEPRPTVSETGRSGAVDVMADAALDGRREGRRKENGSGPGPRHASSLGDAAGPRSDEPQDRRTDHRNEGSRSETHIGRTTGCIQPERAGNTRSLGDAGSPRTGRDPGAVPSEEGTREVGGHVYRIVGDRTLSPGTTNGVWADVVWLYCRDGKARPASSGILPLVARSSRGVVRNRAARLKGYGNGLCLPLCVAFCETVKEHLIESQEPQA